MKSLKDYICESMFDEEDIETNVADAEIIDWIVKNYKQINTSHLKISKKPNKDGKYVVDYKYNVQPKDSSIVSLTNGMFVWGEVEGDFNCSYCTSLTSLAGAPEKVGGDFYCLNCTTLTSLKGAPKIVKKNFYCVDCNSLTSLEGAPKEVGRNFNCNSCRNLTSLDGISKKVGGNIYCHGCAKNLLAEEDIKKAKKS